MSLGEERKRLCGGSNILHLDWREYGPKMHIMSPTGYPWAGEKHFETVEFKFMGTAILYDLVPKTAQ